MRNEGILIIDDGSPASLAACLMCEDPGRAIAWLPAERGPAPKATLRAVERHADLLGMREVFRAGEGADGGGGGMLAGARMLIDAGAVALSRDCGRVIWPVSFDDLEQMASAADTARLITHLLAVEVPTRDAVIEIPFLDLSAGQIMGLLRDMDAPTGACWWCLHDGESACGRCGGCEAWGGLGGSGEVRTVRRGLGLQPG